MLVEANVLVRDKKLFHVYRYLVTYENATCPEE